MHTHLVQVSWFFGLKGRNGVTSSYRISIIVSRDLSDTLSFFSSKFELSACVLVLVMLVLKI